MSCSNLKSSKFQNSIGKWAKTPSQPSTSLPESTNVPLPMDGITSPFFHLYLRRSADKWLTATVKQMCLTPKQKMWTMIMPLFKCKFATVSGDRLIMDGLTKLSHQPHEQPRDIYSRLSELIYVLNENNLKPVTQKLPL
jgi:hypothetical protein